MNIDFSHSNKKSILSISRWLRSDSFEVTGAIDECRRIKSFSRSNSFRSNASLTRQSRNRKWSDNAWLIAAPRRAERDFSPFFGSLRNRKLMFWLLRTQFFLDIFVSRSVEREIKKIIKLSEWRVLTSVRVVAIVTQEQIHVIKYMASFVIFPGAGAAWVRDGRPGWGAVERTEVARGGERS